MNTPIRGKDPNTGNEYEIATAPATPGSQGGGARPMLVQPIPALGIYDEWPIPAGDTPAASLPSASLGPVVSVSVIAGSGSLVYLDAISGASHTVTGLTTSSPPLNPISIGTIRGTGNGSGSLTLRLQR